MGVRLSPTASAEQVWAKTLTASPGKTSKAAVALYNKGSSASSSSGATISFRFADIPGFAVAEGLGSRAVTVTDVWSGNTSNATGGGFTAFGVPRHGTAFINIEA